MTTSQCDPCPGGYYCLEEGLEAPSGLCGAGKCYCQPCSGKTGLIAGASSIVPD
ncbi:hypothetical protein DPMN_185102 [Dreissena polymorpha]|uniref:Uncharacterized protein n=1 Tax=Dreissena polymorpha TaxID=45954 RepID=A0A9D4DLJ8_DREPO|nr:hypothetical protein DPMN_185102 [Dreissena polymorpha]